MHACMCLCCMHELREGTCGVAVVLGAVQCASKRGQQISGNLAAIFCQDVKIVVSCTATTLPEMHASLAHQVRCVAGRLAWHTISNRAGWIARYVVDAFM